ncbi:hypothetical protein FOZ61_010644 [Perkinsus olseni]|uniref:Uncharacterized protein n=1 Tax=Perkinsus olseni TaxID=32597 RepID=A0A7J6L4Y3_PEROL|nr:hypothetical protein FOZ61_010644 [Perkinsus olseni]KAF4654251.1 hypothetical protein FOL46_008801 [Perkinsus olseni]
MTQAHEVLLDVGSAYSEKSSSRGGCGAGIIGRAGGVEFEELWVGSCDRASICMSSYAAIDPDPLAEWLRRRSAKPFDPPQQIALDQASIADIANVVKTL